MQPQRLAVPRPTRRTVSGCRAWLAAAVLGGAATGFIGMGIGIGVPAWAEPDSLADAGQGSGARQELPVMRIDAGAFEASEGDIRKLLESTAVELLRAFPQHHELEPLSIVRGDGPFVAYRRTDRGEIEIRLATGGTYWSQYAYQFAHEFCHVLCGFTPHNRVHLWFEEVLCETASLFAMRAMARSWRDDPPYANWRDYRDSLRDYADDVIAGREHLAELHAIGMAAFHRRHQQELESNPNNRELNGAMAVVLLPMFEADPARWEAVRWLNHGASADDDRCFAGHLRHWQESAPERHHPFIRQIRELFDLGGDDG